MPKPIAARIRARMPITDTSRKGLVGVKPKGKRKMVYLPALKRRQPK